MGGTDDRLEALDALRGAAVLGILWMNVVSFGLLDPAYFNLRAGGGSGWANTAVGVVGEVLFDQKMMGLFSALFGAGIVLFVERVGARHRHPVLLSLWRNLLLGMIGLVHASFWDGDVLLVYAICAPAVLAARRLPVGALFGLGGAMMTAAAASAVLAQRSVNTGGGASQLGWYWFDQELDAAAVVEGFIVADGMLRALGMMLIGVGLYRTGVLQGQRSLGWYRRAAVIGVGTGAALGIAGVVWLAAGDHSWRVALVAAAPNTLGTAPMVVGYVGVVMLARHRWLRATDALVPVGRMALTNYLTQTALGLVVLREWWGRGEADRVHLVVFVVAVWALQIWWSRWWLQRFTQGPLEWLWRLATYGRWAPLRR